MASKEISKYGSDLLYYTRFNLMYALMANEKQKGNITDEDIKLFKEVADPKFNKVTDRLFGCGRGMDGDINERV